MAAKLLASPPHLSSLTFRPSKTTELAPPGPWRCHPTTQTTKPNSRLVARALSSLLDPLSSSSSSPALFFIGESTGGYSLASYYTSLGLFVISVPGLWSLIKRSVKSKVVFYAFLLVLGSNWESVLINGFWIQIVQKTYIGEGEGKNAPNQVAGEILSFFTRNNFVVLDRGETITSVIPSLLFQLEFFLLLVPSKIEKWIAIVDNTNRFWYGHLSFV